MKTKLNKAFIALTLTGLLATSYYAIKLSCWANMIAAPYMVLTFETKRCDRWEAAHYNNELAKENNLKHWVAPECPIDKESCNQVEKLTSDYEENRTWYHKWFRL